MRFSRYYPVGLFVAVVAVMAARHLNRPDFVHLPPESFGNPDSIIAELTPALNKGTRDPKVFLECGKAYLRKGTMLQRRELSWSWKVDKILEKSSDLLSRGIELDSNSAELLYYHGLSMLSQHLSFYFQGGGVITTRNVRSQEAIAALERARQLHPKDDKILTELGHAYLARSGQDRWTEEGGELYIGEFKPNEWTGRAQEALETAVQLNSQSEKTHRYLGDVYYVQEQYREAFQEYLQAVTLGSPDPDEYRLLADRYPASGLQAYGEKFKWIGKSKIVAVAIILPIMPLAILDKPGFFGIGTNFFERAVALDSSDARAVMRLISSQLATGQRAQAVRNYFALRRIDPVTSYLPMGVEAWNLRKELLQAAIQSDPGNYVSYVELGHAYRNSFPSQTDSAIAQFRKAIEVNPHSGAPHCALGEIYLQMKDTVKALQFFRSALFTRDTTVLTDILGYYVKLKQIDDATNLASTLPRGKSFAFATIADYYVGIGDSRRAEEFYLKSLAEDDRHTWADEGLGRVYAKRAEKSYLSLLGCELVGDDGVLLGLITPDTSNPKSFLKSNLYDPQEPITEDDTSLVASRFIIHNKYSGPDGALSPFNRQCVRPPKLVHQGSFVSYLSDNPKVTPRVSASRLVGFLTELNAEGKKK